MVEGGRGAGERAQGTDREVHKDVWEGGEGGLLGEVYLAWAGRAALGWPLPGASGLRSLQKRRGAAVGHPVPWLVGEGGCLLALGGTLCPLPGVVAGWAGGQFCCWLGWLPLTQKR